VLLWLEVDLQNSGRIAVRSVFAFPSRSRPAWNKLMFLLEKRAHAEYDTL